MNKTVDSIFPKNAEYIFAYYNFRGNRKQEQGVTMLTPFKAIKREDSIITQTEKAGRDLFSTAVSKF